MKYLKTFENYAFDNDLKGWVSTSQNNSGFKDGDQVKSNIGQKGTVHDVLVSPDKKTFCVVVKWDRNGMKSIAKYFEDP
jgi:hypothetical protein